MLLFNYVNYQYELWRSSDGTSTGTYAVKTDLSAYYSVNPTPSGSSLFFTNYDYTSAYELWVTDGTAAGTNITKDIMPGYGSSNPYNLYPYNGKVYFNATDASYLTYLWSSDGTAAGTRPVKKTVTASIMLGVANSKLLFNSYTSNQGNELWATDATATGTKPVKDIWPGYSGSNPYNGVSTGSLVYFIANDGITGGELWKSDGTAAGTQLVKDITPGGSGSDIFYQVNVNGRLYFIYADALWSSDGTNNGTAPVNDVNLVGVTGLWNLTPAGSKLFFTGYNAATGQELYGGNTVAASSSNADMITVATTASALKDVYPNPAKNVLNIKITAVNKGSLNLLVTDVSGKPLINKTANTANGESIIQLNISQLPAGTYFLKIISADGKENGVSKFIKQ